MNLRSMILPLLLCAGTACLCAQENVAEKAPEELVQLRRQFESRALGAGKLLAEQYANALSTIIKDSAAEGDYNQALAAQRRREQLASLYSKSGDDTALANVIMLKPGDARVNGAVNYDRNQNALVGWKTVGSIASWDVTRVIPGSYDVTITYAVAEIGEPGRTNTFAAPPDLSTGGEFEFYEDSSLTGAEQNRRSAQVNSTGGPANWTTLTLPPLKLARTSARLALRITKAKGAGGVMNLQSIRLSPSISNLAGATNNAQRPENGSSTPADEFATVQQGYIEHLRSAIMPVVKSYTESLRSLASGNSADRDLAADYKEESRRAAQLIEEPRSIFSATRKDNGKGRGDGFREMRGVTYVPSPLNTGDRFKVRQGTDEFFVRLLWVSCGPTDASDATLLKEFAGYFHINEEDVAALGQRARDFTAGYLAGKSLTLLARGPADESGSLLVSIRPDGLGDFAGVLVDHGLAMIKASAGRKGPARTHEETVLQELQTREDAARTRPVPPGAWARMNE